MFQPTTTASEATMLNNLAAIDAHNTAVQDAGDRAEAFDAAFPGWEEREVAGTDDARFIDYSDVANPEEGVVWGYGGDHRVYVPAAFDEFEYR